MLLSPLDAIQNVIDYLARLRDELESHRTDLPPYASAVPLRYRPQDITINPPPLCAVADSLTQGRDQLHDWLLLRVTPEISGRARAVLLAVKEAYHSFSHYFGLCIRLDAEQEDRRKLAQVHDTCYELVETARCFYLDLQTEIQAAIERAATEAAGGGGSVSGSPAGGNGGQETPAPSTEPTAETEIIVLTATSWGKKYGVKDDTARKAFRRWVKNNPSHTGIIPVPQYSKIRASQMFTQEVAKLVLKKPPLSRRCPTQKP